MNTKILAAIGAVALCSTVAQGVESQIVGYQAVSLPSTSGWMLLTPTFVNVDHNAKITLADIKLVKPGAATVSSKKKVGIQKMDLITGALDKQYWYTTAAAGPWVDTAGAHIEASEVAFEVGEGMAVYNTDPAGSDLAFQFSGEVAMQPVSCNIAAGQWTIIGNFTPASVTLDQIVPKGLNGSDLGSSKKKIGVQKMCEIGGALDTQYWYTTATSGPWVNTAGTHIDATAITFGPGEAMAVYNSDTTKPCSISFPCPIPATAE